VTSAAGRREHLDRVVVATVLCLGAVAVALSPSEASPSAYAAGAAGLIAAQERLRREFSPAAAILTTLLLFAGTSLFWAMTASTTFPDAASFGAVSALLFLACRVRLGAAVVVWLLAAVTPWLIKRVTGDPGGSGALFSSTQGWLSLTPVAYVALVGSFFYVRRNPPWAIASFAVFALWVAGAVSLLPGGGAGPFSHGLTSALALFAPGLATVIEAARRRPLWALAPLVLLALANNYWLMVQYTTGMVPKDAPVSFATMMRQQLEVHARDPYAYLFAFPANAWFALRERLPIDRYELLAFEPRYESLDITLNRAADRFLLEGWDAPGPDEFGPVRWIGRSRATIALPLTLDTTRGIEITVTARARLEEPPVEVDLGLELNGRDIGRFMVPAASPTDVRAMIPASAVGRIGRAGYNRLTFVSYGVRRAEAVQEGPVGSSPKRSGGRVWPVAIYRIRLSPTS
jgi:hypothetical protein